MSKQILYAIWQHDQFPYVLGGRIEEILPDGMVRLKGQGNGAEVQWVKPIRLLPYSEGLALMTKVSKIARDYKAVVADLHDTAKFKVEEIIQL